MMEYYCEKCKRYFHQKRAKYGEKIKTLDRCPYCNEEYETVMVL